MTTRRIERATEAIRWADRPIRWALRFRLAPGPFKALRELPFMALCRICQLQILAIEKIAT